MKSRGKNRLVLFNEDKNIEILQNIENEVKHAESESVYYIPTYARIETP